MNHRKKRFLPWVDPSNCVHPGLVALLKFKDSDETLFQSTACGKKMTASSLRRKTHLIQGLISSAQAAEKRILRRGILGVHGPVV